MAFPTALNSQITDSITQANLKVLGDSPAVSTGELYVATSQALSNAAHNATVMQEQAMVTAQASLTAGVRTLQSMSTASTGKGTRAIASAAEASDLAEVAAAAAMAATAASSLSPGL